MEMPLLTTVKNVSLIVVNATEQNRPLVPLVGFSTYRVFLLMNGFGLTGSIAVFGVCSNSLNLVVYLKLGLRETTNMSFFTLALVDWVVSVCSCLSVLAHLSEISPVGEEIVHLGYQVSAVMFPCLGLGAWITAVLSVERCLCIVLPLKVSTADVELCLCIVLSLKVSTADVELCLCIVLPLKVSTADVELCLCIVLPFECKYN